MNATIRKMHEVHGMSVNQIAIELNLTREYVHGVIYGLI